MTMPTTPPGWYHAQGDPPSTQRWWDGSAWVGGPVAGSGPPPSSPPQGFVTPSYPSPGYGPGPGPGFGYLAGAGGSVWSGGGYSPRPPYAAWWRRFGGYLLDAMIIGIPGGFINRIVGALVPKQTNVCTNWRGDPYLCEQPTGVGLGIMVLVGLVIFAVGVGYYTYFIGTTGQTIGKRAVGIVVVDKHTGAPIGTGRAVGRYFGAILSAIVCLLGYLWAAWDDEKQTWHDKMVNSIVVEKVWT